MCVCMCELCRYNLIQQIYIESQPSSVLDQGLANYGPYAKSNPIPVLVNKVLLKHNLLIFTLIDLHISYDSFPATTEELSSCGRDNMACKA